MSYKKKTYDCFSHFLKMGRKSRLKHKKRYYLSKPAKLIISVPLEKLPCTYLQHLPEPQLEPPQLIVSVPLEKLRCTYLQQLPELQPEPPQLIVSVPLEKLRCTYLQQLPEPQPEAPQLIISIPLTRYIEAPVDSLRSHRYIEMDVKLIVMSYSKKVGEELTV